MSALPADCALLPQEPQDDRRLSENREAIDIVLHEWRSGLRRNGGGGAFPSDLPAEFQLNMDQLFERGEIEIARGVGKIFFETIGLATPPSGFEFAACGFVDAGGGRNGRHDTSLAGARWRGN